jgi:hypothetical protein
MNTPMTGAIGAPSPFGPSKSDNDSASENIIQQLMSNSVDKTTNVSEMIKAKHCLLLILKGNINGNPNKTRTMSAYILNPSRRARTPNSAVIAVATR